MRPSWSTQRYSCWAHAREGAASTPRTIRSIRSRTGPPVFAEKGSSGDHAIVPEQRIDARLAATERLERFHRGAASADRKDLLEEARAGERVQHAVLRVATLLERAVCI